MTELIAISPELLFEIAAGSVGGFCSKAVDYPLDTAKTILQAQQSQQGTVAASNKKLYTGTWDCLQHSIRERGFLSLYSGIGPRLLGSMAENAVCFLAYSAIKKQLLLCKQEQKHLLDSNPNNEVQLSLLDFSLAGAGAGAVVSFVMTPLELLKCRLQVSAQSPSPLYRGSIDCMCQTIKQEGLVRGLYKGHMSTMMREVPGNFIWYLTYEMACDALVPTFGSTRQELPVEAHMTAGAAAGVLYWAAIYPMDAIKTILQTSGGSSNMLPSKTSTFAEVVSTIYQEQGLRGFYRGFGVTAARAAPANAVLFAGYEQTVTFLKNNM